MLTAEQIRDKIFDLPYAFNVRFKNKEYGKAKYLYDMAVQITVFVDLPEADRITLFGNRAYKEDSEELQDGMFRQESVQKAYAECWKANETRDKLDFRNMAGRKK